MAECYEMSSTNLNSTDLKKTTPFLFLKPCLALSCCLTQAESFSSRETQNQAGDWQVPAPFLQRCCRKELLSLCHSYASYDLQSTSLRPHRLPLRGLCSIITSHTDLETKTQRIHEVPKLHRKRRDVRAPHLGLQVLCSHHRSRAGIRDSVLILPQVMIDFGTNLRTSLGFSLLLCKQRGYFNIPSVLTSQSLSLLSETEKEEPRDKGASFHHRLKGWLVSFLARAPLHHEEQLAFPLIYLLPPPQTYWEKYMLS